ncbi:dynactin subunit 3 [Varanus komodoensis]|uniref:Dynactin subunit 3 n=1 Tax=Varanus komodoensis TaxID=61221 RepID=A0A8D2LNJ0_VARKO|nr:dynactin subunit 3 [Varanus komodoensis]
MAAVAAVEVQQLQRRLDALEERVFGAPAGAESAADARKIADGLVKVQVALGNIASKRERVKILFKKIEDILKYLDPQYIDRMAIPDAMKLQFILAEEQSIMAQAALLEQVNSLQPYLDSAHIKAAPDHAAKLQRLSQIHIQQQDQCEAVSENVRLLLEDYNKMTLLLSKQFVQWDDMLTQLEAAKHLKPASE